MNDGFGHEVPARHLQQPRRAVARWLVVIGSTDGTIARLFAADRGQVAEFDAGTEEVAQMASGAPSVVGAGGPEWDRALAGHTAAERAVATVYELDV